MSKSSANVGGHIVWTFSAVDIAIALRHELGKEVFHIYQHIRIGIFLNE